MFEVVRSYFLRAIFVDFIAHGTKESIPVGVRMEFIRIHLEKEYNERVAQPSQVSMFA